MIQSMTGYGAAQHVDQGMSYALEIRSVNSRYFKLSTKLPEHLQFLETEIQRLVRTRVARGSVAYALRVRSDGGTAPRPINLAVLQSYVDQVAQVELPTSLEAKIDLSTMVTLPGVCDMPDLDDGERQRQLDLVADLTNRGMEALVAMRQEEGQALHRDLLVCCETIRTELSNVSNRAPSVVEQYHERLKTRVGTLMQASELELEVEGLVREVAIFAERCDISEEVARLHSHLDQFVQLCDRGEQIGRTLDFLTQEMLREANTIAAKANDTAIARSIVKIKGSIDRLKEQVQNVE